MTEPGYVILDGRGVIAVAGEDARTFLQGLVSNDVAKVGPERALYAAFLTPQGKFLHDFFMVELAGALVLDCEAGRRDDLVARLARYKLRAKVELSDRTEDYVVAVAFGPGAASALGLAGEPGRAKGFAGGVAYVDPRDARAGVRAVLPRAGAAEALEAAGWTEASPEDYEKLRLTLGLPDGSRDMEVEKAILMECRFDELGGIDWDKGCFVGQELTARTRYRGLVKKRLVPVAVEGPLPAPGTPVLAEGKGAGVVRSGADGVALALIRLEHLEGAALTAGEAKLTPRKREGAGS